MLSPVRLIAAAASCAAIALTTGCVSAVQSVQSAQGGAVATPTRDPVASCPLLTSEQLHRITGSSFNPLPFLDPASTDDNLQCQWTATDGLALVTTRVLSKEPRAAFDQARRNAQRTLGPTSPIVVKGVDAAFLVPNIARTYLLTDDSMIEMNMIIPEMTPQEGSAVIDAVGRAANS